MTQIELLNTIRTEIERYEAGAQSAYNPHDEYADFFYGKVIACEDLLSILDTLPEQSASKGLEEEIDACWQNWLSPSNQKEVEGVLPKTEFAMYARHFAEWGARHSINWGDVQLLDTFILELSREEKDGADWGDSEKFYTEVLRRFHEFNDKKIPEIVAEWEAEHLKDREMKAIIKETGQAVEVVSRFMPKKRNAPSRDWMCNLSNGTCINESELEYISDNIEDNRIIDIDNVAREYAENHYSEWEVKMKAPDKIYLGIQDLGSGYVYDLSLDNNGEQEYIRKDALLEWANKRLEEFRHIAEISNDVAADGEVDAFEELIDKLNEM